MANHRSRMRMDLGDRAAGGDFKRDSPPVVHSSSPAGSPSPNFANLLLPISSRFNVGHGKGKDSSGSSSNKSSPKKSKEKKKTSKASGPSTSSPTQSEPCIRLNEVSVEVLREWETSFNSLLKHPDGVDLFESFLKSEFSEENIQFWKACEKFKAVPDHSVEKEAGVVYEEFLASQAPKLVNIDHQTSREIVENMKNPDKATFYKAQQSIYLLMARDSFVRFIKSEHFQKALKR